MIKKQDIIYLKTRYYSPFLKRFISFDETAILDVAKGEILGANLYAYCNNNPVMNEDPSGYLTLSKFWVALSLDILFACLIPAVPSAYDFIGRGIKFTMKAIAKKQGLRAAKSIARKKIKAFSFGIANKLMTSLRYAMRKLFKIIISNAWTASFTSLLGKILNSVDILSNFLSLGSMIACFLDFVSDGKFDNKNILGVYYV